jgi:hypothetical protein
MMAEQVPLDETGQYAALRSGDRLVHVPVANVQAALDGGMTPADPDEYQREVALTKYKEETPALQQAGEAALTSVAEGGLALPALASNLIPGVDGQSGAKWLSMAASMLTGRDENEVADELRTIAEASPYIHFTGEAVGSLASGGGVGSLASKAVAVAKTGGKLAQALSAPAAKVAGITAENMAQSVALANNEAFQNNKELTGELATLAAIYGGAGPLAIYGAGAGARIAGRTLAKPIDRFRARGAQAAANDAYEAAVAQSAAKYQKDMGRAQRIYESDVAAEARAAMRGQKFASRSEKRAAFEAAKEEARSRVNFEQPPMPPRPQRIPVNEPVKLENLFKSRDEAVGALQGLANEAYRNAGKKADFFNAARRGVKGFATREARRAMGVDFVGQARRHMPFGKRFAVEAILSPMAGTLTGNLINHFGAKGLGLFYTGLAKGFRGIANSAAKGLLSGRSTSRLMTAGKLYNRAVTAGLTDEEYEQTVQSVNRLTSDQQDFADSLGETYGSHVETGVMPTIVMKNAAAAKYLKDAQPPTGPISPGMPQLGMMRPDKGKQEAYMRKVAAVQNPFILLGQLESGIVDRDTVDAVRTVYPSLFLDMMQEVQAELAQHEETLSRHQQLALDAFFGSHGAVFAASAPRSLAVLQQAHEATAVQHGDTSGNVKRDPGRSAGNPTLLQQYKTTSQKLEQSVYGQ